MKTLRGRIAFTYGLLLIAIIFSIAFVVAFAFHQFLYDEVRARVDRVADDITAFVELHDPTLDLSSQQSAVADLADPRSLDHWASPTTFIQVQAQGAPPITSRNLGELVLPSDPTLNAVHPANSRQIATPAGHLYIDDRRIVLPRGVIVLEVAEKLDLIDQTIERGRLFLITLVLLALPITLLAAFGAASNAVRPIEKVIATMKRIGSAELHERVDASRTDELGELARTFNAMLDRLEEIFNRERRFIADISHELKTPLTVINANAHMLKRWAQSDEAIRRESLDAIAVESSHLGRIVEEMLTLARADSGESIMREPVELDEIIADVVRTARPLAAAKYVTLTADVHNPDNVERPFEMLGNAVLLRRIFANLIDNAVKFTPRGDVDVCLTRRATDLECTVSDTGVGIPREDRERIFERLYRVDVSRSRRTEGTGLGLPIARTFVKAHGGWIRAEEGTTGGTVMRVHFDLETLG